MLQRRDSGTSESENAKVLDVTRTARSLSRSLETALPREQIQDAFLDSRDLLLVQSCRAERALSSLTFGTTRRGL